MFLFCQLQQLQCLHYGSTKAYLCSPMSSILSAQLHRWLFTIHEWHYIRLQYETWYESVELTGALLKLFFAWNVTRNVWSSWKPSVVMHCDRLTHPLFWCITGACTLMIKHSIFSVMVDRRGAFNAGRWVENQWIQIVLANKFSAN